MKLRALTLWKVPANVLACVLALCAGFPSAAMGEGSEPAAPAQPPAAAVDHAPDAPSSNDLIVADARAVATALGMPLDRQELVLKRLDVALRGGKVLRRNGSAVNGVFAFQLGEGGLLWKVAHGKGLARFVGNPPDKTFSIKGSSFGASIGGSSEWGVGLVMGLQRVDYFGGDYRGRDTGATAADASTDVAALSRSVQGAPELAHDIYLVGAGAGLSAGASRAKLTFLVQ